MRYKSCLRTFSQPSKFTREAQICSICRGTKTALKNRQLYERSPKFLNSDLKFKEKCDNLSSIDHCFIEHFTRTRILMKTPSLCIAVR